MNSSDDLRAASRDVVRAFHRLLFGLVVVVAILIACTGLGSLVAGGAGAFVGLVVAVITVATLKVLASWTSVGGPVGWWRRHFEED